MLHDQSEIRWMDTGNQTRQELRLRLCAFRMWNGEVGLLCRFWLLTAMYHRSLWAAFLSDKQPQIPPSLSAPNPACAASLSHALLRASESQAMRNIRCYRRCRLHSATAKGLSHEFTVQCWDYFPPLKVLFRTHHKANQSELNVKRKDRGIQTIQYLSAPC